MKNIASALLIALCLLGHQALAQAPAPPTLLLPADMTYMPKNTDFQFKWSAVAGATEYLFWWSGDGINWQSVANAGTTLSWALVEDHPADVPFRWKVQAKVAGVYTANSTEWRIYDVPASPPTPTAPGDLSYMAPNTNWTYTWSAVSGASEYELSESTNGGTIWTQRTVLTNSAASPLGGCRAPIPPQRPSTGSSGPRSAAGTQATARCDGCTR